VTGMDGAAKAYLEYTPADFTGIRSAGRWIPTLCPR